MVKGKAPVGAILMSVLSIISVAILMPLAVGGTISAAVALAGEDFYKSTPDDTNGFKVLNLTKTGGSYCTGHTTSQTYVVNEFSQNWTKLNSLSTSCISSTEWVRIQIPATVLPDPANYTFSGFILEMVSFNEYANNMGGNATFNMTMTINGSTVLNVKDISTPTYKTDSSGNKRYYLNASIQFNAIDEIRYRAYGGECYPNCVVVLNISGYAADSSTNTYARIPPGKATNIRVATYTTDIDTGNFVLAVLPYLLAGVNGLIALAATPMWNPVSGFVKNKGAKI